MLLKWGALNPAVPVAFVLTGGLNLPGQHLTEIETKIYEALKTFMGAKDERKQKETDNR